MPRRGAHFRGRSSTLHAKNRESSNCAKLQKWQELEFSQEICAAHAPPHPSQPDTSPSHLSISVEARHIIEVRLLRVW